ncbi:DUF2232 domain-containing protein [Cohnella suwonensis]|uniref:DUF2232 domain-containing protein n=1 Tax=Cohnella suwonensis TaxID=696072 RepID=A0ABW0LU47_9BACL
MNATWKSLAWSAAAWLLLITLATPLNFVTIFLMMTPFVVLYRMLSVKSFAVHVLAIGAAAFLLAGGNGPIVATLGFFFLVPSVAMGHIYKKGSSAKTAVLVGFVIVLAQLLLELALFSVMFDIDLKAELASMLSDNLKELERAGGGDLFKLGGAESLARDLSSEIMNLLPMILLLSSILFTIITHALSRVSLQASGIEAPALPKAMTWRVPRSFVLYYLIAFIAVHSISNDANGYWAIVAKNLEPILGCVFTLIAFGFLYFLADAKKWSKAVPFLLCVPVLFFPQAYLLIGLLDTAFPLRKVFVKQ